MRVCVFLLDVVEALTRRDESLFLSIISKFNSDSFIVAVYVPDEVVAQLPTKRLLAKLRSLFFFS